MSIQSNFTLIPPCMEKTGEREQYQYRYADIPVYPYRYK